jgi:hypothetical protein
VVIGSLHPAPAPGTGNNGCLVIKGPFKPLKTLIEGSAHRARLRFQLCKKSGQRADASGLETLSEILDVEAVFLENPFFVPGSEHRVIAAGKLEDCLE